MNKKLYKFLRLKDNKIISENGNFEWEKENSVATLRRKTIEAVKKYLEYPTEENMSAAMSTWLAGLAEFNKICKQSDREFKKLKEYN